MRPTCVQTSIPVLPEGDLRFFIGLCVGETGVDHEMSAEDSRSQSSNRPSQTGREGSDADARFSGFSPGFAAALGFWKYDCRELLLTSFKIGLTTLVLAWTV